MDAVLACRDGLGRLVCIWEDHVNTILKLREKNLACLNTKSLWGVVESLRGLVGIKKTNIKMKAPRQRKGEEESGERKKDRPKKKRKEKETKKLLSRCLLWCKWYNHGKLLEEDGITSTVIRYLHQIDPGASPQSLLINPYFAQINQFLSFTITNAVR